MHCDHNGFYDLDGAIRGVRVLLERAQATYQSVIDALDRDIQNGIVSDDPIEDQAKPVTATNDAASTEAAT